MKNKKKSAFTLIELLVVIAIIGILSTLAVVALQNARSKARDSKRIADVKQMQTALELYFNDNGSYPTSVTSTIATSGIVYMSAVPTAPTPVDGSCTTTTNAYTYASDGSTYTIIFCLGSQTANLSSGQKVATRDGMSNYTPPFICGEVLTDSRDSQQYPTVLIGTQCWMAKNLNYSDTCSSNTWTNGVDTRWCGCYQVNNSYCTTYGKLYQWSAAMAGSVTDGAQGLCPSGWHIPTAAQIATLNTFLGGSTVTGGKIKQTGTTLWISPNGGATNESGFTALPSGYRSSTNGNYTELGFSFVFWSSTFSSPTASYSSAGLMNATFFSGSIAPSYGYSVRCIKN